jgi:4-hydroxythreonine-4-phosphate dehydrogenase
LGFDLILTQFSLEPVLVGISVGDVNGIGPEVIVKTYSDERLLKYSTPVVFCAKDLLTQTAKNLGLSLPEIMVIEKAEDAEDGYINVIEVWSAPTKIEYGQMTETGGKYARLSLEAATKVLLEEGVEALVTAPIHKKAMQMAGFADIGHTEYLTKTLGATDSLMMLMSEDLRVALVTGHQPVSAVAASITKELILAKLQLLAKTLKIDFGIDIPKIAVLGLNPHAGDDGLIGLEEKNIIKPALEAAREAGVMVFGPMAADGFFGSGSWSKYDAILAMYHDQGLAPFKALSFGSGVNYTCGLPQVRTSPDHGTGFDIAGQNLADAGSFRAALNAACDAVRLRDQYKVDRSNPMKAKYKSKVKRRFDEADDKPVEVITGGK